MDATLCEYSGRWAYGVFRAGAPGHLHTNHMVVHLVTNIQRARYCMYRFDYKYALSMVSFDASGMDTAYLVVGILMGTVATVLQILLLASPCWVFFSVLQLSYSYTCRCRTHTHTHTPVSYTHLTLPTKHGV